MRNNYKKYCKTITILGLELEISFKKLEQKHKKTIKNPASVLTKGNFNDKIRKNER